MVAESKLISSVAGLQRVPSLVFDIEVGPDKTRSVFANVVRVVMGHAAVALAV